MPSIIAPPQQPTTGTRTLSLLHLEDSIADQRIVGHCLHHAQWNCRIEATDSLQIFEQWLQQRHYDIIVADYYLPGFTAMQAWQVVQQLAKPPPFVLLSGAIGEAAAVEAMRQGIADYLLKDDMARLPHVLTRALEVAEARRSKEQALHELQQSQQQLAALTEHLQQSIEQERAAIAREIHDDIGGALTAVKFDLAWIYRNARRPEKSAALHEHAQAALEMLQHALGASQRIMLNLRPPVLDQGLVAAVQWLTESFSQRTGIAVQLVCSQSHIEIPAALQVVAYRTAQEALTNVSKYAQASQVYVELSDQEGHLTLEVRDNGCGINPSARDKPKAFGLRGLTERARTVGGWLDVSSQAGRGTSIIVSLPLPAPHNASA
ncbi:MAG: response regulator [Comamonas sp.]|nr:response regulator [Comamonas sp.]